MRARRGGIAPARGALACNGTSSEQPEDHRVFDISPVHMIVFAAIALLVVGPRRLPELARSLGRGVREMKSAIVDEDPPAPTPPAPAHPVPNDPVAQVSAPVDATAAIPIESLIRPGDDQPERPAS